MTTKGSSGSVLLLTVMVLAVLTTTTFGAIAVRFDQLAATDKLTNSAVAKLAADSGLAQLRDKLINNQPVSQAYSYNIETAQENQIATTAGYRPNPRSSYATYEPAKTSLPRCIAAAVLDPWVNSGKYLSKDVASPTLIFYYANIVNDTPLGILPANANLSVNDKKIPISDVTSMGHFYNPFAPLNATQDSPSYWTIKLGGPDDQFLTQKASNNVDSLFRGLDVLYSYYLPRLTDSGIAAGGSQTGLDRIDSADLTGLFEDTIRNNNFKVWLDASISDTYLYQYGLGDLFVANSQYRIKWMQPSLWNDLPEADVAVPYKSDDLGASTVSWTKKGLPLLTPGADIGGWGVSILRGASSFSFVRLSSASNGVAFSPGQTIDGFVYGGLDGLRLNSRLSLQLFTKVGGHVSLKSRAQDQGKLYGATVTQIGSVTAQNIAIKLKLSSNDYETPTLSYSSAYPTGSMIGTIALLAAPQFSTNKSLSSATVKADGDGINANITVQSNGNCVAVAGSFTACPAVGDLIGLSKSGQDPLWGMVETVSFTGTNLGSFTIDKLRRGPKPTRHQAVTYYTANSNPRIAYFGGAIDMNDYDGGYASESAELWIYDPEGDSWSYPNNPGGTPPGPRAGASMVYDNVNGRLVVVGGYYHEAVTPDANPAFDCEISQQSCLYTNRPHFRIAKRIVNDVYAYNIAGNSWEKMNYTFTGAAQKIENGVTYTARVVSTLANRSGLEGWRQTTLMENASPQTININGAATNIVVKPSAAGLAIGDELYLSGKLTVSAASFTAWGRITGINYAANSITVTVRGYKKAAPTDPNTVTLSDLSMQVLSRLGNGNGQTCTGVVTTSYSCNFSNITGFAVGDQVVLERYVGSENLTDVLSGFISYTSGTSAYFVADERDSAILDFADQSLGRPSGGTAVAFPVGRYGATLGQDPTAGDTDKALLYQGASKNFAANLRFNDVWQAKFNAGTGTGSIAWTLFNLQNPQGPNTDSGYYIQNIRSSYFANVFTSSVAAENPGMVKDLDYTDPRTEQHYVAWDETKNWTLKLDTTGQESLSSGQLVPGAQIIIERQSLVADGAQPRGREVFHGYIVSNFGGSYDSTKIVVRHNPSYADDKGLLGDSAASKISIYSYLPTTAPIRKQNDSNWLTAAWDGTTKSFTVSSSDINLNEIPPVGALIQSWKNPNSSATIDATLFVVKGRTYSYNLGAHQFRFDVDTIKLSTPLPIAFGSNQVVGDANSARVMSLGDQNMPWDSWAAPDWATDASANNRWVIRRSATGNPGYAPGPRQAAALGSYFDGTNSQLYMAGASFGPTSTVWKKSNAGKTTYTSDTAWSFLKTSPNNDNGLPSLWGSSMIVYRFNSQTKAVYFNGKLKYDNGRNDYGRTVGARILGRPDLNRWGTESNGGYQNSDNTFYLDDTSSTLDSAGFVSSIYNNFPTTAPTSVKDSFRLKGYGITPTSQGGWSTGKAVCPYLGQKCDGGNDYSPLLGSLGTLGRSSSNSSAYGGYGWGSSRAVLNPGSAFLSQGGNASAILSGPTFSGNITNGRWEQDGYAPYLCDSQVGCGNYYQSNYGSLATNFQSDKTIMFAGYTKLIGGGKGGAILVTPAGVGTGFLTKSGILGGASDRWYSYCAASDTTVDGSDNYTCNTKATRYLPWLPDIEDMLFLMNAAVKLASADSYKVTGYYGNARRAYIVTSVTGEDAKVQEITP